MSRLTRVERRRNPEPAKVTGLAERVALFVGSIHRQRAEELLQGFALPPRARAVAFLQDMKQWDSAQRQARLAHEFGLRQDADERTRELVEQTEGQLRAALVASLPPSVRRQFPQHDGDADAFPLAVRALAARLVREASR